MRIQPLLLLVSETDNIFNSVLVSETIINGDRSPMHRQYNSPQEAIKDGWHLMGSPMIHPDKNFRWWFTR